MLETQALSEQALKNCLAHGHRRVQGDLIASTNANQQVWDGVQMRHIFTQSMTLWRRYGKFDVILDADGALVGFIDHDKYQPTDDSKLTREAAEKWIRDAGVVPASARLENFLSIKPPNGGGSGEGTIWKAVFALAQAEKDHALLEVELNVKLKAIAAVRPMRREGTRG